MTKHDFKKWSVVRGCRKCGWVHGNRGRVCPCWKMRLPKQRKETK